MATLNLIESLQSKKISCLSAVNSREKWKLHCEQIDESWPWRQQLTKQSPLKVNDSLAVEPLTALQTVFNSRWCQLSCHGTGDVQTWHYCHCLSFVIYFSQGQEWSVPLLLFDFLANKDVKSWKCSEKCQVKERSSCRGIQSQHIFMQFRSLPVWR